MKKLWKYIRNNPAYAVAIVFLTAGLLYGLWEEIQVFVYLFGFSLLVAIIGAYLNIKDIWR